MSAEIQATSQLNENDFLPLLIISKGFHYVFPIKYGNNINQQHIERYVSFPRHLRFKLNLIINDEGDILAIKVTTGNIDGRQPVPVPQIYLGHFIVTKNIYRNLWKLILRKRMIIEKVFDQLNKHSSNTGFKTQILWNFQG